MKFTMLTKVSAAVVLAVSASHATLAAPVESSAAATSPVMDASRIVDQLSHSLSESNAMHQVRDSLNELVNQDKAVELKLQLDELVKSTDANQTQLRDSIKKIAELLRKDLDGFVTKVKAVLSDIELSKPGNESKFIAELLAAFRELVEKVRKVPYEVKGTDTSASHLVARALDQRMQIMVSDSQALGIVAPPKPVVATNPYTDIGLLLGELLEGIVTGQYHESADIVLLRLMKEVVIAAEQHNASLKFTGKALLDEALEAIKKATEAALVANKKAAAVVPNSNSNDEKMLEPAASRPVENKKPENAAPVEAITVASPAPVESKNKVMAPTVEDTVNRP